MSWRAQASESRRATGELVDEHAGLTESLWNATSAPRSTLDAGRRQQAIIDDLLDTANASRRLAERAVADAEQILVDANRTLGTLRGRLASLPDSTPSTPLHTYTILCRIIELS